MSDSLPGFDLARLRAEFDASFASEAAAAQRPHEELLAVRANTTQLAIRVKETAAILRCPDLVAMPSSNPALCGLAGVRGTLVAVYSIAELIGESRGPITSRWLLLCAADHSVALLFDELVGFARVDTHDILGPEQSNGSAVKAKHLVQFGGVQRPLVAIPELLEAIYRIAEASSKKA